MDASSLPVIGFDLDDTLWDTAATLKAAHVAMVEALPSLPEAKTAPGPFKDEMMATKALNPDRGHDFTFLRKETLRRLLSSEEGAEELVEKAYTAWFAARNAPKFYEGAISALQELRDKGYRLCAISDGNANPMQIPELSPLLEFAVSATEAGAAKPDSRPFLLAAEKAAVPCSSMVYVGDNYDKDVVGSKDVGMRAVWVRTPPSTDEDFILGPRPSAPAESRADAEVVMVAELPSILETWRTS
mmetsp:Transcript_44722/g.74386  ORF Transcript_44722/g.74386 Transcript_44722/m.74386 type:complete len:244 (+) Transcript_44722:70-801(+)